MKGKKRLPVVVELCCCVECCWGFFLGSFRGVLGEASFFEGVSLVRGNCCSCDGRGHNIAWEGEFWAEDDEEEDDEDEEDDDVEEDDVEADVIEGCCGLWPFIIVKLLMTGGCLGSGVRAGD